MAGFSIALYTLKVSKQHNELTQFGTNAILNNTSKIMAERSERNGKNNGWNRVISDFICGWI